MTKDRKNKAAKNTTVTEYIMQYPNTFLIISTLRQLLYIGNFFQGGSITNYIHKMTKDYISDIL